MEDFSIMFDYLWYFYHRIQEGSFALWNPYSLLGRIAVQFNMVGVSMFTPFLLFSEFTLGKFQITNVLGIFMAFFSIYLTGRILRYNRFYSLLPVVLLSAHLYFKSATCSLVYTFLSFYPVAVAFLVYNIFKYKRISFLKFLVFIALLSVSFIGSRLDFLIYALGFTILIFLILGLYQLPDKKRMLKFFSLGLMTIIIPLLANAWHLSLVFNALLDNVRVSVQFDIMKLVDPLFIKWLLKDLIYQSPLILCLSNLLLYKVLRPESILKKISFTGLFSLLTLEFIILGVLVSLQPHFGGYYESIIKSNYAILLLQFFITFIILSIIYFYTSKLNVGKTLIILASFFAGFYIAHQTLLLNSFGYYDLHFYNRPFIRIFQGAAFLLVVLGSYSFAIIKKKNWFLTVIIVYLFIGETGVFFLNELFGIPWIGTRAYIVAIPFMAILILEGLLFLTRSIPILLKRTFTNLKYSAVKSVVTSGVKVICFIVALLTIRMVFVPTGIINNNLVYYGNPPFASTTKVKDVIKNINNVTNKEPYMGSFIYNAYKNTKLVQLTYNRQDSFKRVFVGNTIKDWSDHEYYKFLPAYSQTINTVPIYASSIPEHLANIFNEIYNRRLTVHPEYDGLNRLFVQYKKDDCKKRRIAFNTDYGSTVTIKPNLDNGNPLYPEILAQEGSRTPRAFLSDKILIFDNYMDEYDYLKNDVAMQGLSLTGQITTSDDKFTQIIKDDDKSKLKYVLEFKKDEPEHIILDVVSNKDAYLALMDLYSKGWKAYIDGKKRRIYRGYIGTRFIILESGEHTIEFKYDVPGFKASLLISFITWIILIFVGFYLFVTKKWGEKGKHDVVFG